MTAYPDFMDELLAQAYYDAALAHVDMRIFAGAVETIRGVHEAERDGYRVWDEIDDQINLVDDTAISDQLVTLRRHFYERIGKGYAAEITETLAKPDDGPQAGWNLLLQRFGEAFFSFRLELMPFFVEHEYTLPPQGVEFLPRLRRWVALLRHERWVEAFDCFTYFGELELLNPIHRGGILATAARVLMLYVEFGTKRLRSQATIERAAKLIPKKHREYVRIDNAWGSLYFSIQEYDKAKQSAGKVLKADPANTDAHALLGDIEMIGSDQTDFERFERAEQHYRNAIQKHPGSTTGYNSMITMYGYRGAHEETVDGRSVKPHDIEDDEAVIRLFARRIVLCNPFDEYSAWMTVGYAYQRAGAYTRAHEWFDRAISADPARLEGFIARGYTSIEEENYRSAERAFRHVIELDPTSPEGTWGLAFASYRDEDWEDVERYCRQCLETKPLDRVKVLVTLGDALYNLRRYDDAEPPLFEALQEQPDYDSSLGTLEKIADRRYQDEDNDAAAEAIYGRIRELVGADYEGSYRNRLANIRYWHRDYAAAAAGYRQAIAASEEDAVYRSNLALALENLLNAESYPNAEAMISEAVAHLDKAIQLTKREDDKQDYARRHDNLRKRHARIASYGKLTFRSDVLAPMPTPIAVELSDATIPAETGPDSPFLSVYTPEMKDHLRRAYGIPVPGVRYRGAPSLPPGQFTVLLDDVLVASDTVQLSYIYTTASFAQLTERGVPSSALVKWHDPVTGGDACWVLPDYQAQAEEAGMVLDEPIRYVIRSVEGTLARNLHQFMSLDDAENLLNSWTGVELEAELVQRVLPKDDAVSGIRSPRIRFARVLRALVRERVPLTDPHTILTTVERVGLDDIGAVVEAVRGSLRAKLPANAPEWQHVPLNSLDPVWEDRLDGALDIETMLALTADIRAFDPPPFTALIIERAHLRPIVRQILEGEFPDLSILAASEAVSPDMRINQSDADSHPHPAEVNDD